MEMTQEIKNRIFAAASALYEENDRNRFPTVYEVRQLARVNMNDASAAMKEWRRMHVTLGNQSNSQIPLPIQTASSQLLTVLWQQAQELANESLLTAQSEWEIERAELDTIRTELAQAYKLQGTELDNTKMHIVELENSLSIANEKIQVQNKTLVTLQQQVTLAEQKALEVEHRAQELRLELDRAHQESDRNIKERDQARYEAATLKGRLETLEKIMAIKYGSESTDKI